MFCLPEGRKVNTLAGYANCAVLQLLLANAPRFPANCGINATELWRNLQIVFRASTKKPGHVAGFSFVVQEKAGAGQGRVNIWRRPEPD
jgi:hypothetical protein